MKQNVAQYMVSALVEGGFRRIYCLPGYQNDDFFDAIYSFREKITPVQTRHEQGAAYMALGAAMASGNPQVCCVVPGPGLLNAGAALATAWSVNAPVLMIVGQTPVATFGSEIGELHEIPNQMAIIGQFSKLAVRIDNLALAAEQINEAIAALHQGRPRPVSIEVPMDVWSQEIHGIDRPNVQTSSLHPTIAELETVVAEVSQCKRPLIFVGSGAHGQGKRVQGLAKAINAPVMSNRSGRGIISASQSCAILPPVGRALWKEVDCIIGLGCRLGAKLAVWGTDADLTSVHIDCDASEFNRGVPSDIQIHADLEDALPMLLSMLGTQPDRTDWERDVNETGQRVEEQLRNELAPQVEYLSLVRSAIPDNGILVMDVTQLGYVAELVYPAWNPRTYLVSGYQGTLGWSIPAALGAADAMANSPVVAVCGDGGAMFNIQELATAQLHGIPLTVVIFDDSCFGNVRRFQVERYDGRVIATDLKNPNFVSLAESFGVQSFEAAGPTDLAENLAEAIESRESRVITVKVGEFPSPWPFLIPRKLRPA